MSAVNHVAISFLHTLFDLKPLIVDRCRVEYRPTHYFGVISSPSLCKVSYIYMRRVRELPNPEYLPA